MNSRLIYKSRTKSVELQILDSLDKRMCLSDKDKQHYLALRKGFEGELCFDAMMEKVESDCLVLNDLLLRISNTVFQIDSLMIRDDAIYLFEIKNYEGDYYYEADKFYKVPKTEIYNPVNQLARTETRFRQLLDSINYLSAINSKVIFINPEFTLYNAPLGKSIIFPTQLKTYLKSLNRRPSGLTTKQTLLAEKLVSLHLDVSPYQLLPAYDYEQLRRGMTCLKCLSFLVFVDGRNLSCHSCGYTETLSTALLRCVHEYKLLFSNRRITTTNIYEWCNQTIPKQRVRRFLEKNFRIVGVHQWSFYKEKEE